MDPDFRGVNTVIKRYLLDLMKSRGFSIYQDGWMAFRASAAQQEKQLLWSGCTSTGPAGDPRAGRQAVPRALVLQPGHHCSALSG